MHKIQPYILIPFLCCAVLHLQPLSAADPEPAAAPVALHVQNAELRAAVRIDNKNALVGIPPQVCLDDIQIQRFALPDDATGRLELINAREAIDTLKD